MKNLPDDFPRSLKKYFWDTDFSKLNKNSHSQFIIGRILEYGDERAIKWLFKSFKRSEIGETIEKRRNMSPLSAHYWGLILSIPRDKILCLQQQSQNKLQKTWPH
ncbi:MAG: hypothetical protein A2896_03070 [Candidatus Nealsonbacteria bacterium RIFCSPLOWO2_01_FULL_43_32]|uniref:DUF6922 domain-containing protein n=1 Tax=Candidatus Nealsonbacteria bacterium RIFCSPLOWO2_01_FULL_43_32 TaxID=1801672 RepID=A0A1G2EEX1_9BACT|nr:MAG: hypothetical protein A2896_03070 [Candidatus Nealsonbacteria bacterium RIFCSPLOWO2_01_FULL_43_32]